MARTDSSISIAAPRGSLQRAWQDAKDEVGSATVALFSAPDSDAAKARLEAAKAAEAAAAKALWASLLSSTLRPGPFAEGPCWAAEPDQERPATMSTYSHKAEELLEESRSLADRAAIAAKHADSLEMLSVAAETKIAALGARKFLLSQERTPEQAAALADASALVAGARALTEQAHALREAASIKETEAYRLQGRGVPAEHQHEG